MLKVGDVFTGPARAVRTTDTVEHARREMIDRDVSLLAVVDDDDALVGVITQEDVIRAHDLDRAPGKRMPVTDRAVELAMDPRPLVVDAESSAPEAARRLLDAGARGAPVVRDRDLLGILTDFDLLEPAASAIAGQVTLAEALTPDALKVPRHASIPRLWRDMQAAEAPIALVVEGSVDVPMGRRSGAGGNNVVGVVTVASLVASTIFEPRYRPGTSGAPGKRLFETRRPEYGGRKSARHVETVTATAEDVMRREYPTLDLDMDAAAAARLLAAERAVGAPVIAGEVLGTFTRKRALELWVES